MLIYTGISLYAPVKVNPVGGRGQTYDNGLSDHTRDSDNSNSFGYYSYNILTLQMVEIWIF